MILLQRKSLSRVNTFRPESFQLQLGEKDSSATITVGPDAPDITIGDWMQDDTEPGAGIVWRVKSISTDYAKQTRSIGLEHVLQTLKDTVLPKNVTASDMGGGSTVSAKTAAKYVLGKQSIWKLGTFAYSESAPFEFNGDTLLDALETICTVLEDSRWTYDTTAYPFTLNIEKRATAVSCELRAGRNLSTITRSVDKNRMYTRIYPIGRDDLRLSGNGYIQKNTDLYGVVSKVETDQSKDTEEKLRIWAKDRLNRHCEPNVSITVNGLELSDATGEPLDRLDVGRLCRIPMPELGTVIEERITRLNFKDKMKSPEDVTITLANNREDVASIFKNESGSASKSGRSAARAGGIAKKDLENKIENEAEGLYTTMTRTAKEIRQEAVDTKKELQTTISQTAENITLEFKKADDSLSSRVKVTEDGIKNTVQKNGVISAINQTAESIKISAKRIQLDGSTIVGALKGAVINSAGITVSQATITNLSLNSSGRGDFYYGGRSVSWQSKSVVTSISLTTARNFQYMYGSSTLTLNGSLVTDKQTATIYYLGRPGS